MYRSLRRTYRRRRRKKEQRSIFWRRVRRRRNSAALSGGAEGEGTAQRIPERKEERTDLVGASVKKLTYAGDKNGNLFERSEFISVQPDRRRFSPFRRSLDFSFCELYLFIKEKKKWTPTLGERKKSGPPKLWEGKRKVVKLQYEKTKH